MISISNMYTYYAFFGAGSGNRRETNNASRGGGAPRQKYGEDKKAHLQLQPQQEALLAPSILWHELNIALPLFVGNRANGLGGVTANSLGYFP